MTLQFVKRPQEAVVHPNILLYGPPKSGKTAGALSLPGGKLLLNLDLPNAVDYARSRDSEGEILEVAFGGMESLIDVSSALTKDEGIVANVIVDPIGDLHRRLLEEASNRAIRPSIQHYGDVAVHIERFCRWLCEQPYTVVIVCHEAPVKDEATGVMERLPWTGTSNPALGSKLMGMVDIVGYTGVITQQDGSHEYVAQLVTQDGRRGGDRFDVLAGQAGYRRLDLTEWVQTINEARTPTTTTKEAA